MVFTAAPERERPHFPHLYISGFFMRGTHSFSLKYLAAPGTCYRIPGLLRAGFSKPQFFAVRQTCNFVSEFFSCHAGVVFPFFTMVETSRACVYEFMGYDRTYHFFFAIKYDPGQFDDIKGLSCNSFFSPAAAEPFTWSGIYLHLFYPVRYRDPRVFHQAGCFCCNETSSGQFFHNVKVSPFERDCPPYLLK